jgi:hypothetical protein
VIPNPNNEPNNLGGVADISKIDAALQVVHKAETQAVKAAKDAQVAKGEITQQMEKVPNDYDEACKAMKAAQKELDKMVELAKTAKTQAEKVEHELNTMNASLATNIEPPVRAALTAAEREAKEASRKANEAAIEARRAVVDAAEAIIGRWRAVANDEGNNRINRIAQTSSGIIEAAAVQVEWLVGLPPFDVNKAKAKDVLAAIDIDKVKVVSYADAVESRHHRKPGDSPRNADIWNDAAKAAFERAQEACK